MEFEFFSVLTGFCIGTRIDTKFIEQLQSLVKFQKVQKYNTKAQNPLCNAPPTKSL